MTNEDEAPIGRSVVHQDDEKPPRVPPRWFVRSFWAAHRGVVRSSRGRFGLWQPGRRGWGAMRLTTTGRRSGRPRTVVIGYFEDGSALVGIAMNGWADPDPAWWLNLQAHPEAEVDIGDGPRKVRAHAAHGGERERLWDRWRQIDEGLDALATRRSRDTAVVVFEPVS
jgi:deazaflavin-dependent oxidoreductase (nitroreductase family)